MSGECSGRTISDILILFMGVSTRIAGLCPLMALTMITASGADWLPVGTAELSRKTPRLDKAADAEAIFWDVRIEDRLMGGDLSLTMIHYIRIKIYTERGKEQYSTVEIPRFGKRSISEVAGRTIKSDGTAIELKKDAIFDRELVKTKGLKLRGKTFVLPNVEPGDIIEYRYRETRDGEVASHMRLQFQREIPLWSVTYHLKPLSVPWLPFNMRSSAFQCEHPPFVKETGGFYATTMSDVPAFKEEADMPPEDQVRAWVLIYYEEDRKADAEKFWKETGKEDFAKFKPLLKADDLVKKTAAEIVSGIDKAEDKVAALELFCRTMIRNIDSESFQMTAEERNAVKENRSPGDTLKRKTGTGMDVNFLFASLVNAAGLEARMARMADRGDIFFNKARATTYFLNSFSVAVRAGENWTFHDPATAYLEPGMLRWQEESQPALISDPKEGFFASTQVSPPFRSKRQRRAEFTLKDDGTLEGTVQYTYTGHTGASQKRRYRTLTAQQQEEEWKDVLVRRISTAEISDFSMLNATDPLKPLTVSHKVIAPGYAVRTGKRILLQPAFFQKNTGARYTEAARKWDVYFEYGWSEDDEVIIDLPEGWELDAPVAPAATKLGAVGNYEVHVQHTKDGGKLIYRRQFDWGRDGKLLFPVSVYPQLKQTFDFVHDQDGYTISLKAARDAN